MNYRLNNSDEFQFIGELSVLDNSPLWHSDEEFCKRIASMTRGVTAKIRTFHSIPCVPALVNTFQNAFFCLDNSIFVLYGVVNKAKEGS